MARTRQTAVAGLIAVLVFAVGFGTGRLSRNAEVTNLKLTVRDAEAAAKTVDLQKDIVTLRQLREGKSRELIPELELWVIERLSQFEPESIAPGTVSDFVIPRAVSVVNDYRRDYPDTAVDPKSHPKIARALAIQASPERP